MKAIPKRNSAGFALIVALRMMILLSLLVVGLLNTLKVSVLGIVLTTIIGTVAGVARLSSNWLVAKFATFYVEGLLVTGAQPIGLFRQLFDSLLTVKQRPR